MGRHLTICSDRAVELATALAERSGKSVDEIVEEAVAVLNLTPELMSDKMKHWLTLLEPTWAQLRGAPCDFKIEDLYDPETGLPA